jgi:hypothetical protein
MQNTNTRLAKKKSPAKASQRIQQWREGIRACGIRRKFLVAQTESAYTYTHTLKHSNLLMPNSPASTSERRAASSISIITPSMQIRGLTICQIPCTNMQGRGGAAGLSPCAVCPIQTPFTPARANAILQHGHLRASA